MTTLPLPGAPLPAAPRPRLLWLLLLGGGAIAVLLFFLFGFRTFYGLWCRVTSTGLSPNNASAAAAPSSATGRMVTVYFEGKAYDGLPVRFYPLDPEVRVEVGNDGKTTYRFKNLSDQTVRLRPVHTVSPRLAVDAFGMKVCFCFNDQTIGPGEVKEFPVVFTFAPSLDERVDTVTVRYNLFEIRGDEQPSEQQKRIKAQIDAASGIVSPGFAEPEKPR
jgi:cytochrome c oxidase assembly protein subunit 11